MKTISEDVSKLVSVESLQKGLMDRPSQIDPDDHRLVVQRVIQFFQKMKQDQPRASSVYQPGGEWAHYLSERQEFYDRLLEGDEDYCQEKLNNFWRNELGPIVKEYAKYEQLVNQESEFVDRFQQNISRNYLIWKEIYEGNIAVLEAPQVGNPWGYMIEGKLVLPKATRFHAIAKQVMDLTQDVDHALVAEIGGGYGGAPYYLLRDRPQVTYVDFDLPETLVIAAYYLLCCFPERDLFLYGEDETPDEKNLSQYAAVLLPNFELPKLGDATVDVFFNSFSFSEVPYESLVEYLAQVQRVVKSYFLHNNMDRQGVVNRGFKRIPASEYPLDSRAFKRLYKQFDLFHGKDGDYREFLYQRTVA
ncbi:MAG: putative sugar O-methyltransferase [Planctomycetota bacterium]|nr:putative sugar O-methyltransferase [Planctomycetota bacterium]